MKMDYTHLFDSLRRAFVLVTAVLVVTPGCSVFGINTVEEARYDVLGTYGDIEIREYAAMVIAETRVEADYEEAGNIAFRRLFDYISGDNDADSRIEMTAPVMARGDTRQRGETIAMTAPVMSNKADSGWRYFFVLPARYTLDSAPRPRNPQVTLSLIPAHKAAALRYSGSRSESTMIEKTRELQRWLAGNGHVMISPPRSAGYNPPWTLPFLRRNEVMVEIE